MPVFTEVLPIDNATGASFQLPATEDVKIMAVRVTVDNGGGTDTQPELAMLAPTGAVIATERHSEAIPAGDSGMASWALRLAKKAGRAVGGIQFGGNPAPYTYGPLNAGGWLSVVTHDVVPYSPGTGIDLQDSSGGGISLTSNVHGGIFLTAAAAHSNIVLTINNDGTIAMGPGAGSLFINSVGGVVSFQFVAGTKMGFFGAVPVVKPAVAGARGGNAALGSLLTALANLGLITNSTTP